MNRLPPWLLLVLLTAAPAFSASETPAPAATGEDSDIWSRAKARADDWMRRSQETADDLWQRSRTAAGEAWEGARGYLDQGEPNLFGRVWGQVLPTLEETLALEERHQELPESTWFGEDQESNREAIDELLDEAVSILSTSNVQHYRDRIAQLALEPELEAIALTSLMEAADRVDSTTGVQMAYLKSWSKRSFQPLTLRVPELLPGEGSASCLEAAEAARTLEADLVYLDPPYNQHSYLGNYHVWESLVRWDKPEVYGVAMKRRDVRERLRDGAQVAHPVVDDRDRAHWTTLRADALRGGLALGAAPRAHGRSQARRRIPTGVRGCPWSRARRRPREGRARRPCAGRARTP